MKDTESVVNEKYELASVVREMYMDAEKQRRRTDEILDLNEELLELSQSKEDKVNSPSPFCLDLHFSFTWYVKYYFFLVNNKFKCCR